MKWLLNFAKITDPTNFEVDSESQYITMRVLMDDVVYMKYLKEFEPEEFARITSIGGKRTMLTPS